jgi:hypothetical protein
MEIPDTLPAIIEYRVGSVVLIALPRRPVRSRGSSSATDAATIMPRVPLGTEAWRLPGGDWRPLSDVPVSWRPFLNRDRPSAMDPRPACSPPLVPFPDPPPAATPPPKPARKLFTPKYGPEK